jgi:flagellar hook-basal body complex protein FliE
MDIRTTSASLAYAANKPATAPSEAAGAVKDFVATLQNSETTAIASMSGGADPHALVQALAQTELAVETAVTIRDKVVEAYQEILRMPV